MREEGMAGEFGLICALVTVFTSIQVITIVYTLIYFGEEML